MGFFDAKNRFHETENEKKRADGARIAVILLSCVSLILISFGLRYLYENESRNEEDAVSKEWVKETLDIYAGKMASEDELRELTRSISAMDGKEITVDPEQTSDEDLKRLYLYVDEKIAEGLKEVPEENRTAITENMVLEMIRNNMMIRNDSEEDAAEQKNSGEAGVSDRKKNAGEREEAYEDLVLRLNDISQEIRALKENGIRLKDLKLLTEKDVKLLIRNGTIGKEEILAWIRASESSLERELSEDFQGEIDRKIQSSEEDLVKAYRGEDEIIRKELRKEDEKILELFGDSAQRIDEIFAEMEQFYGDATLIEEAEQKITLLDEAVAILNDSMAAISETSASDHSDLIRELDALREEMAGAAESLRSSLEIYKGENDQKQEELAGQLSDTLREDYERKIATVKNDLLESNRMAGTAITELRNSLRDVRDGLREEYDSRFSAVEEDIRDASSRIESLDESIVRTDENVEDLRGSIDETKSRVGNLRDSLDETNDGIGNLRDSLNETNANIGGLSETIGRTNSDVENLKNGLSGNRSDLDALRSVFDEISDTIENLSGKTDRIGSTLMEITGEETLDGALLKLPNLNMNGDVSPEEVLKGRTYTCRTGTGLEGTMEDHRGNITADNGASSIRLDPGFYDGIIDLSGNNEWQYAQGKGEGYENGYGDGRESGIREGYNSGYEEGLGDGYDSGYTEGFGCGVDSGYQNGLQAGRNEVIADPDSFGINTGYSRCILEGVLKAEASAQSASKKKISGSFTITIDLKTGEISKREFSVSGNDHTEVNNTQDLVGAEYTVKGKAIMTISSVRFE